MASKPLVQQFVAMARRHNSMVIAAKRAGIDSLAELARKDRDQCLQSARRLKGAHNGR